MGNTESISDAKLNYEALEKYKRLRPNLSENEIQQIYGMFQYYKPEKGYIQTKQILEKYAGTPDCEELKKNLQSRNEIDFNQYFLYMEQFITQKKNKFGDMEIETDDQEATCNLCVSYDDHHLGDKKVKKQY